MTAETPDEDLFFPQPRRKWKRWVFGGALVLLILLAVAEWQISAQIANRLKSTLSTRFQAQLRFDALIYVPPFGAIALNPVIWRDDQILFKADRIRLSLAKFPGKDEPVIISSLRLNGPELNLSSDTLAGTSQPASPQSPPAKLSEILRLEEIRINDGKVRWRDSSKRNAPPMTWEGLNLDIDTTQKSASSYSYRFSSRAYQIATASSVGVIDVDSLQLEVKSLMLRARAEPEPARSPLPPDLQALLKRYRINGSIVIEGSGIVPLRDAAQASFKARIQLEDAMAEILPSRLVVDRARADITCEQTPGRPITIGIEQIDLASGGGTRTLVIDKGQITLDPATARWAISEIDGHLGFDRLFATTSPLVDSAAPQQTNTHPFQLLGRIDFTAIASGELAMTGESLKSLEYEVIAYPRAISFVPPGFSRRVEGVGGGEVRIRAGMIIFQELSGRYGDDALRLRSARLPIEGLPDLVQFQEISASVTFQQPIRRYQPDLDKVLDIINPSGGFLFSGSYTHDDRQAPSANTFDFIISTDNAALSLTSHHIPITGIRSDSTLTSDGFQVNSAQGAFLGGRVDLTAQLSLAADDPAKYEGELTIQNADLGRLATVSDNPLEIPLNGKLTGQTTFAGVINDDWMKHLRGQGSAEIVQGDFFRLKAIQGIVQHIKGLKQAATVGDAGAMFSVADGVITLRNIAINAPILGVQGRGKVGVDGRNLDLTIVAAPLADWREKMKQTRIPIVSNLAGDLAGAVQKLLNTATGSLIYQFHVTGAVMGKVSVMPLPAPVLTRPVAVLFGRMLTAKKDETPLDWMDESTTPPAADTLPAPK